MRKIKNKKVIRRLSDRSFQANRFRNRITILAILLTTMLFTILFTIGSGITENDQQHFARSVGSDSHGDIHYLTKEQYEILKEHPLIKESAPCTAVADRINNSVFVKRHVEAWHYPQYYYAHRLAEIIDGKVPVKADEILMDETSMKLLGLEAKADQRITLNMQIRQYDEKITERSFHIVGVIKSDPLLNVGFVIVSDAYMEKYQSELSYEFDKTGSNTGMITMGVNFSNPFSIQKKLNRIIEESGYSINEGDENYINARQNTAYISYNRKMDAITIVGIVGGLLLIILTGFLIIYNVFQISIHKDIHYYGLLKTIGVTGKQIKKILYRQIWRISLVGIPLGLLLGFLIGMGIVPIIVKSNYGTMDAKVTINPFIFLGAIIFTIITVVLSEQRPVKIAAKVSPIEALCYTEIDGKKRKNKNSTNGGHIWKMAFSNLARNRSKSFIVIFSLSLVIVLMNSVFTIVNSYDVDTYVRKFMSSDFTIGNAQYFANNYIVDSEETAEEMHLTESFIQQCEQLNGFKEGGRAYGAINEITLKKDSWNVPDYIKKDENGDLGFYISSTFLPFNKTQNGDYLTHFYGLEEFPLYKLEVWKGEKDWNTIKEKLDTGDYILTSALTNNDDSIDETSIKHNPGDKITLTYGNGQEKEFTILSIIKGNAGGLSNRTLGNFTYYTTDNVFKNMASSNYLMTYLFNTDNKEIEQIEEFLKKYTIEKEPFMDYQSKLLHMREFSLKRNKVLLIGGILTFTVGIIGILNFINAILMGIITRRKEFAMLEAIGMTRRQISHMVVLEGIYYCVFISLFSTILSWLSSVIVVRTYIAQLWFTKYQFVFWPVFISLLIMFVLGTVIPKIIFYFNMNQSIVEQINNNK